MAKIKAKRRTGLQLKMSIMYFAVIGVILILLNIIPTLMSENFIFQTKQETMESRVSIVTTALSTMNELEEDKVETAIDMLNLSGELRVVVTDNTGLVVYDSSEVSSAVGKVALQKEIVSALRGYDVFRSAYEDDAFQSAVASPIVCNGILTGGVYIFEYDSNMADLLRNLQSMITTVTIVICIIAITLGIVFSNSFSSRVRTVVSGMREIHEGNLEKRITVKGNDELTEVAEQFNSMADELEHTEHSRNQFISDASHEMKTPLAAIKLLTDSILQTEDIDTETTKDFVTDINSEADRLSRLVEKLLMLSKSDAEVAAWRSRVDLRQVATRAAHMADPLATREGVDISTELGSGCFIYANEDDIYQVVYNLVENAIKYNHIGGTVSIYLYEQDNNVVLIVEDTGMGIPEKDLGQIFERFYRVDKDRSREKGGSGLGLSIVWENIHRYEGDVSVTSTLGKGTRFTVTFPLYIE